MDSGALESIENLSVQDAKDTWGEYSSLYDCLTKAETKSLENAIRARRLGRFHEARHIWDHELPPAHKLPVLAIERSELESRFGLDETRHAILDKALQCSSEWRAKPRGREAELISILRAAAAIHAFGSLRDALDQAEATKRNLKDLPVNDWTDVEVGCLVAYYSVMNSCFEWSNWLDVGTDLAFPPVQCGDIRKDLKIMDGYLTRIDSLFSKVLLLRIQSNFLENKTDKIKVWSDFLRDYEYNKVQGSQPQSLALLSGYLQFAEMLIDLEESEEAEIKLDKTDKILSSLQWVRETDQQIQMLRRLRLRLQAVIMPADCAEILKLTKAARSNGDRPAENVSLTLILISLNKIDAMAHDDLWTSTQEEALSRYSELHSHSSHNAIFASAPIAALGNSLGPQSFTEAADFRYKLEKFEATFSKFQIPIYQRDLYRGAASAARILGEHAESESYESLRLKATMNCPRKPSQFYRSYADKPFVEWAPYLLEIVLEWMFLELREGKLSTKQAVELLMLHEATDDTESGVGDVEAIKGDISKSSPAAIVDRLYGSPVPVESSAWTQRFRRFEDWLWESSSDEEQQIRHTVLAHMQQARSAMVSEYVLKMCNDPANGPDEDLQLEMRQFKSREMDLLIDLRRRIHPKAMGASQQGAYTAEWMYYSNRLSFATSFKAYRTELLKDKDLQEIQQWFESTYSKTPRSQPVLRLTTLGEIAICLRQRYTLFGTVAADACLEPYQRYDKIYSEQRMERSILRSSENLTVRTRSVASLGFANHYNYAMGACIEAIGAGQQRNNYHRHLRQDMTFSPVMPGAIKPVRDLYTELINWTQMKKGRNVAQSLGAEAILPKSVLAEAQRHEDAQRLLSLEADLQAKIDKSDGDLIELTKALESTRRDMRNCPSLKPIMKLRDGLSITEPEIQSFAESLGPDVLLVDYLYISVAFTGLPAEFVPIVYKNGQLASAAFVDARLNHSFITRWVRTFMDTQRPLSSNDASAGLAFLRPLVEPAIKLSKPGDLIVLCPTDVLFNVPLHAIELEDGRPLIERNPIVYTQSLSILRLGHSIAPPADPQETLEPLAVQALSAADTARPEAADMAFAARIRADLLAGAQLTKASFLAACARSKLIHFYGHVGFHQGQPLDHHLGIRDVASQKVTARDLFDVRLRPGAHVSLIGCASGRAHVGTNDDLLGLCTAVLCAGAASVLSAMWPIQMDDAGAFQEAFYDELLAQSRTLRAASSLDLAVALQKAMLRVRKADGAQAKAPFHWAAFMLQGAWDKLPLLPR